MTAGRQSETVRGDNWNGLWGVTMRIGDVGLRLALGAGLLMAAVVSGAGVAEAQSPDRMVRATHATLSPAVTDVSAQRRAPRRAPTRLRVHPRYSPGPNAVRDCTATYVQEFRPSGTVIVPRMNCFWRPG